MNEKDKQEEGMQITKPLKQELIAVDNGEFSSLLDSAKFNQMWKVASLFASSDLVPKQYKGKNADCFIATQMAVRLGVDPMMFMQNTYVVHGTPGMEAKLAIALINKNGPFTDPVQWRLEGEGDSRKCTAFGKLPNGSVCEAEVNMKMVIDEGWIKNSKWKTMPDLMFRYRSASFLGRLYCPEVLMGMQTLDEIVDVGKKTFDDSVIDNDARIKTESGSETVPESIIEADVIQENNDAENGNDWRNE